MRACVLYVIRRGREGGEGELVHLETHPVVDLVVRKRDVILVYGVPARRQSVSRTPQSQFQKKKGEW